MTNDPRSKHYAIKYHWFREHLGPRKIHLVKISSEEQLGNLFTKGLSGTKFSRLQKKLMGWQTILSTFKGEYSRDPARHSTYVLYFLGTLPAVLYQEFLPSGSDVRRFLCSVRNKPTPQILLFCKEQTTIPLPNFLPEPTVTIPLREPTCSHNPSSHYLGQKHEEFYVSLHGLTLSLMFTRASQQSKLL